MRKRRPCRARQINRGPGTRRQFSVAGHEVRMQMGLKDVANRQPLFLRGFQVDFHIALRIDHDRFSLRSQQIRSVRQAAEVELFEIHGTMASSPLTPRKCASEKILADTSTSPMPENLVRCR